MQGYLRRYVRQALETPVVEEVLPPEPPIFPDVEVFGRSICQGPGVTVLLPTQERHNSVDNGLARAIKFAYPDIVLHPADQIDHFELFVRLGDGPVWVSGIPFVPHKYWPGLLRGRGPMDGRFTGGLVIVTEGLERTTLSHFRGSTLLREVQL